MGLGRELLDDHLRVFGAELPRTVPPTAVRMRSVAAREVIARAGLGGAATLDDLLTAARTGDRRWLSRLRGRVDRPALAALARTIALQDLRPEDRTDALALYELMRRALGAAALGPAHQGHHAQFAYLWAGPEQARRLVSAYPRMREHVREALRADLANPYAGGAGDGWWDRFTALLPEPRPVLRDDAEVRPFDRLEAVPGVPVEGPQRVSVVVTAYRPGPGLLTAVRSIVAQTWRNVEVIVVDDASPAEHDEVLDAAVALGERVRLIRLRRNAGTYAARNVGLDAAGGEFVTFQDSDDWSHPRRLELQVAPLLADPRRVASTSDGVNVTDDLVLTRPTMRGTRLNPSSLLFRRRQVLGRIGYFDQVRKGGDSEYLGRIVAAFGARALASVGSPLALIRLSETSLSRAEVRSSWLHPARAAYASGYLRWHDRIRAGEAGPLRPRDGGDRPFAVPRHLTASAGPEPETRYDVVVAADWRFLEGAQRSALAEIEALRGDGLRVAILQLESLRTPLRRRRPLAAVVQGLVDDGLDRVFAYQPVECALLIVRHPEVLQFAAAEPAGIRAGRVLVVADRAPARADGTDRRYAPDACTKAVRRLFAAEPVWCPQDDAVRAALGRWELPLTPYDLPTVVPLDRFAAPASAGEVPIVGTDLCDAGVWPGDLAEALAVLRLDADVRLRLPDRPLRHGRLPIEWLTYRCAEVDPRTFLHQLDFYLHYPSPQTVEVHCRPALEAAAQGRVVLLPERFAAFFGDAAVYCPPERVPEVIAEFRADPGRYAEQSRRARLVISKAHHAGLFLDRVRPARVTPPAQRTGP